MLFLCQLLLNFQGTQVISQLRSLSYIIKVIISQILFYHSGYNTVVKKSCWKRSILDG